MASVIIYGMAKAPNSKLRRFQDSLYVLLVFLVAIPAFKALDSWLLPDYFPRVTQKDAWHLAQIIWLLVVLVQSIVMGLLVFFILTRHRTTQGELRWYQYSLRSLLVLVTLCSLPCSWLGIKVQQAKRQQGAVRAIEELGGR
jgi:heme/copper-type cytochrome/quinol oxidase subunit 2